MNKRNKMEPKSLKLLFIGTKDIKQIPLTEIHIDKFKITEGVNEDLIEQAIISSEIQRGKYPAIGGMKPLDYLETYDIKEQKQFIKANPKCVQLPIQKFNYTEESYEKSFEEFQEMHKESERIRLTPYYKQGMTILENTMKRVEDTALRIDELIDQKKQDRLSEINKPQEDIRVRSILDKMNFEENDERLGSILAKNKALYSEVDTHIENQKKRSAQRSKIIQIQNSKNQAANKRVLKYPPLSNSNVKLY